jgi:hypothetical protein
MIPEESSTNHSISIFNSKHQQRSSTQQQLLFFTNSTATANDNIIMGVYVILFILVAVGAAGAYAYKTGEFFGSPTQFLNRKLILPPLTFFPQDSWTRTSSNSSSKWPTSNNNNNCTTDGRLDGGEAATADGMPTTMTNEPLPCLDHTPPFPYVCHISMPFSPIIL